MNSTQLAKLCLTLPVGLFSFTASAVAQDKPEEKPAAPAAAPAGAPAVDISNPEAVITAGNEAYAKGDWVTAAANFSALLELAKKTSGDAAKLESLYFTLGACYFNVPNHAEAQKVFSEYAKLYPTGPNVNWVKLGLARIKKAAKNYVEAIKAYEPLKAVPGMREDVLLELAECFKENQDKNRGIVLLETALVSGIKTAADVRLGLALVDLYDTNNADKGVALLDKMKKAPGNRALAAEMNFSALKLADGLMQDSKFDKALQAYQNLRKKAEVTGILKDLQEDYKRGIASLAQRVAPGTFNAAENQQRLDRAKAYEKQAAAMIEGLEKEVNYDAVLFYRIGRCFVQLERWWEARIAFQYVQDNFPKFEDKPAVAFAIAFCHYNLTPADLSTDGLKLAAKTEALCRAFIKDYPDHADIGQVADMLISVVTRANDPGKTNLIYDEVMSLMKDSPNKFNFLAIQVQNYLEQYEFDKAAASADKYLAEAPKDDAAREGVEYMRSLVPFFKNLYLEAQTELGKYIAKYPSGAYIADAKYRLCAMMMGEMRARKSGKIKKDANFNAVIKECEDLVATHPGSSSAADATSLIADCYKEMTAKEADELKLAPGETESRAADHYLKAIELAQSDMVAEYSLTTGAPLLKSLGRWKDVQKMYEDFRTKYPDNRASLGAVGEISKAIIRLSDGAFDKELKAAEKAGNEADIKKFQDKKLAEREKAEAASRKYLADTVLENINDPQKEGVEDLMQQLAMKSIPKRKPVPRPAPAPAAAEGAAAVPPPPPVKVAQPTVAEQYAVVEKELDTLLPADKLSRVGQARLLYVKSQVLLNLEARVRPQKDEKGKIIVDDSPKQSAAALQKLETEFQPEDYSSALLALIGDAQLKRGEKEKAAACFNRLIQFFPQSMFLDWALVGQADVAFADKDFEKALKLYTQASEDVIGSKYGEAMMGRARVAVEKGDVEPAEKALRDILGDKSYPPESKAEANALLGEIFFKQQKYPEAFNSFQRLYLSFQKFPAWVARGYLRAGETKEALNKPTDAREVYKQAVEGPLTEKIKGEPDFEKIKTNLRRVQ